MNRLTAPQFSGYAAYAVAKSGKTQEEALFEAFKGLNIGESPQAASAHQHEYGRIRIYEVQDPYDTIAAADLLQLGSLPGVEQVYYEAKVSDDVHERYYRREKVEKLFRALA